MNGASRWLEASAEVENVTTKATAMTLRMTLLQRLIGGAGTYFVSAPLRVFFVIFFLHAGCKPNAKEQRERDLAALPHGGSLADQLQVEAAARAKDADTLTLEALKAALEKDGVTFAPVRQLMGRNQLALYCGSADASGGMIVT